MSAVEGLRTAASETPDADNRGTPRLAGALPNLCPFLGAADGSWRSAAAIRDHRCFAVAPPVPLALEKQRRLCITDAHLNCATYTAALAARQDLPEPRLASARPVARMRPVLLDQPRFDLRLPALRADRASGQAVLVGVLGVAFVAILVARPSDGGSPGPAGGAVTSPGPTAVDPTGLGAAPSATEPQASVSPSQTDALESPQPTAIEPSTQPSELATQSPTPPPSPPSEPVLSGATYRVKSGDTLSAIAARFNTTTRVLVRLNGIEDPSRLKVGQILKLP